MFENLKQIELSNCHLEKLHRAMILTTSINGNSHQIFLSKQNALGTHAERAGGILYVHRCAKIIMHVVENQFCTEEVTIMVSFYNTSEVIRYMDPISRVFYRNFTLINCNPMYPNGLELQNGSWITYGRRTQLIKIPIICLIIELTSIGQLGLQWKGFSMTRTWNSAKGPKD